MGDYYLEKINYKLLNILLIIIAIFFITKLDFYKAFLHTILDITFPIFLAFFISYSLYPCVSFLTKKISYLSSCLIVIFLCISLSILLISFSIPIFTKELPLISNDIMYFLSKTPLETKEITSYLNDFLSVESGIHLINEGASFLTSFLIVIVLSIYFLFNMQKIKNYLNKYELFTKIDRDLFNYYKGFYLIILIEIVEYLVIYFLIGHPYFLLLALLSGVTSVIPLIGALITNALALISAWSISMPLFIATSIVMILVPIFNSYVIEPKIYKKTLKVSLVSIILSCFIFASLFGFIGILLAVPLFLIIKNLLLFFFPRQEKV